MRTILFTVLKFIGLGAGAGAIIVLADLLYRQVYIAAWRAGWRAHIAYKRSKNLGDLSKKDRRMYLYSLNQLEEDSEIVKDTMEEEIIEAETIAQ